MASNKPLDQKSLENRKRRNGCRDRARDIRRCRERRRMLMDSGLCIACKEAVEWPYKKCRACLDKHNLACTRCKIANKKQGLCGCGRKIIAPYVRCERCRAYGRAKTKAWRRKK